MTVCFDSTKIVEMVTKLRKAAEALQRFGEGTRSAKRTRKTVLKLMQICVTLAQCHADHGPAILAAMASTHNHPHHSHQSEIPPLQAGQDGVGPHVHNGDDNTNGMVSIDGTLPDLANGANDPFTAFDMGMHQYWTDTNLDLFTDLVGVDTGLTHMLAG